MAIMDDWVSKTSYLSIKYGHYKPVIYLFNMAVMADWVSKTNYRSI